LVVGCRLLVFFAKVYPTGRVLSLLMVSQKAVNLNPTRSVS